MNPNSAPAPRNDSFDVLTIFNPSKTDFPVYYNSELHAVIQPGKAIQLVKLIAGDSNHGAIKHLVDRMCRLQGKPKNEPAVRNSWIPVIVLSSKKNHMPTIPTIVDQARAINERLANQPVDVPLPNAPAPSLATTPSLAPAAPTANASDQEYVNAGYKFHPVTGALLSSTPKEIITPESIDTSKIEIQSAEATLPQTAVAPLPGGVAGTPPVAIIPPHPNADAENLLAGIRKTDTDDTEGKVIGEVPAEEEPAAPDEARWPEAPTKEDLLTYAKDVMMMNVDEPKTRLALEAQTVDQLKATLKYDRFA